MSRGLMAAAVERAQRIYMIPWLSGPKLREAQAPERLEDSHADWQPALQVPVEGGCAMRGYGGGDDDPGIASRTPDGTATGVQWIALELASLARSLAGDRGAGHHTDRASASRR